jgi:hypothetical protein
METNLKKGNSVDLSEDLSDEEEHVDKEKSFSQRPLT